MVKEAIESLNPDKSDRDIGFNSNHVIHGSMRLQVLLVLSILYQACIIHGYTPDKLLKSTTIPISKDKHEDLSCNENSRGNLYVLASVKYWI